MEEIGKRSEQEAGSSGLEQFCSCYFACSNLISLQPGHSTPCARPRRPIQRRKPRIYLGPIRPSRVPQAWACSSSEPGAAEAQRNSPRPGRSSKMPVSGRRAEKPGRTRRRSRRWGAGCRRPGARLPPHDPAAAALLPFPLGYFSFFFFLNRC